MLTLKATGRLVGGVLPERLDAKYAVVPERTRILKKAAAYPQPVRVAK